MTSKAIEMIETIKSNGAEKSYFDTWAEVQEDVNKQNIKMAKLNASLGLIPAIISSLANYGILILGVYYTMQGEFSVGSILAFQAFLSAFMGPAMTVISSGQTIMEMRTSMERV
jgi:ABC-type bacteriocin/lantibiotic exporter with double-glycine peptidase domain